MAGRASASLCLLLLVGTAAAAPSLFETFSSGWQSRWTHSEDDKYAGRFEVEAPEALGDEALKVPEKARHYGIATPLETPHDPAGGLALQYEVTFTDGLTCGGAYMKFVTANDAFTPAGLKDDTPYTVMFGPDKCGATNKVHLIFRHKNPVTGTIEEKHLKSPPMVKADEQTHVYTAVINPDNTYAVLVDGEEKKAGSLLEDFEPSFLPPAEIDDPEDSKPDDWVDVAKIPDPEATKPDDWDEDAPRQIPDEDATKPEGWLDDEPLQIADPDASMPDDWDEEEDGEWEAPTVANPKCKDAPGCGEWTRPLKPNPAYKGKWSAPLIDNPEYKGVWKPRKIANPEFHEDKEPLKHVGKIGAAAIEIWTMDSGYFFDNLVVASTGEEAAAIREQYWKPKADKQAEAAKAKAEEAAKDAEALGAGEGPAAVVRKYVRQARAFVAGTPALEKVAPLLAPVFDFVEDQPVILVSVGVVPIAAVLIKIINALHRADKKAKAGKAKKTDAPTADDKPANGSAARGAGSSEIQEEEEEEPGVRRRTRRET